MRKSYIILLILSLILSLIPPTPKKVDPLDLTLNFNDTKKISELVWQQAYDDSKASTQFHTSGYWKERCKSYLTVYDIISDTTRGSGIWHIYIESSSIPTKQKAESHVSWSRRIYVIFHHTQVVWLFEIAAILKSED